MLVIRAGLSTCEVSETGKVARTWRGFGGRACAFAIAEGGLSEGRIEAGRGQTLGVGRSDAAGALAIAATEAAARRVDGAGRLGRGALGDRAAMPDAVAKGAGTAIIAGVGLWRGGDAGAARVVAVAGVAWCLAVADTADPIDAMATAALRVTSAGGAIDEFRCAYASVFGGGAEIPGRTIRVASGGTSGPVLEAGEALATQEVTGLALASPVAAAFESQSGRFAARLGAGHTGGGEPGLLALRDPVLAGSRASRAGAFRGNAGESDAEALVGVSVAVVIASVAGLGELSATAWVTGIAAAIGVDVALGRVGGFGTHVFVVADAVSVEVVRRKTIFAGAMDADDEAEILGAPVLVEAFPVVAAQRFGTFADAIRVADEACATIGIGCTGIETSTCGVAVVAAAVGAWQSDALACPVT